MLLKVLIDFCSLEIRGKAHAPTHIHKQKRKVTRRNSPIFLSFTGVKGNFFTCACQTFPNPLIFFNIMYLASYYISPSFTLQHFLCIQEKQVLQSTPSLIILFILLRTLQVIVFILLLISVCVISLLISILGLPLFLIKILRRQLCIPTSWNGNVSFVHVLPYQISSSLVSNTLYTCLNL